MSIQARAQYTPRSSSGQFVAVTITPAIVAATDSATALLVKTAQMYAPVATGELRDSIHSDPADDTGKTVVGRARADSPHAVYVEYGTGIRGSESEGAGAGPYNPNWPGMVAQPYMRPALDECRKAIVENYNSEISLALGK